MKSQTWTIQTVQALAARRDTPLSEVEAQAVLTEMLAHPDIAPAEMLRQLLYTIRCARAAQGGEG